MYSNSFGARGMTPSSAVLEVIPHVLDILAPAIRQVAGLHLLSAKEKEEVGHLVSTMISQKLTFIKDDEHHERIASSAVRYRIEPAIDSLVNYRWHQDGLPAVSTRFHSTVALPTNNMLNNR